MNSRSKIHAKRSRHKRLLRRFIILLLIIAVLAILTTLGWFIINGLAKAVATGDKPVSDTQINTTNQITTTTVPTHPTIVVNASVTTPRIVLYDITHSAMLYSRGADEQCYPASLTKLLTAAIVTEQCTANEEFTSGTELSFVQPGSSTAHLKPGYRMTRDIIIDALLLPSGNDAAYTIAAHVGRKVSGNPSLNDFDAIRTFIDLMNETAQKIGATNSHFSNPDGFFSADHYTTASDMLLIAKNALKYDNLKATMSKSSVNITLLSGEKVFWKNTNAIISPNSPYYFEGATGMKTGSTDESGYCVAASAKRNGVDIIAIVMGCNSNDTRWRDTVSILNQAFKAETSQK